MICCLLIVWQVVWVPVVRIQPPKMSVPQAKHETRIWTA